MAEPMPTFDCAICFDDVVGVPHAIDEYPVCEVWIRRMFQDAFDDKLYYPPRFGNVIMQAEDFADVLGADFLAQWWRIMGEYDAFGHLVYCSHQLREADAPPRGSLAPEGQVLALTEIQKAWPGLQKSRPKHEASHDCQPVEPESVEQIFSDMVRGKDYQNCPREGCVGVYNLLAGCNHVHCNNCGTPFCYVCGVETDHDSDHFLEGGCPRWNQPDAPNAHFDAPDELEVLPPSDMDVLNLVVQRGLEYRAANGAIDEAFVDGIHRQVEDLGTTLVVDLQELPPNLEGFWTATRRTRDAMLAGDWNTIMRYEMIRLFAEGHLGEDEEIFADLDGLVHSLLNGIHALHELEEETRHLTPESTAQHVQDIVRARRDLTQFNARWQPIAIPPRMRQLWDSFTDHVPEWLQVAAEREIATGMQDTALAWQARFEAETVHIDGNPYPDLAIVVFVFERARAHLGNGGSIDQGFVDTVETEVVRLGNTLFIDYNDEERAAGSGIDQFWPAVQRMHQELHAGDPRATLTHVVRKWVAEKRFVVDDADLDALVKDIDILFINPLQQGVTSNIDLIAEVEEPSAQDVQAFVHMRLFAWGKQLLFEERWKRVGLPPVLEYLKTEFSISTPEWLEEAVEQALLDGARLPEDDEIAELRRNGYSEAWDRVQDARKAHRLQMIAEEPLAALPGDDDAEEEIDDLDP